MNTNVTKYVCTILAIASLLFIANCSKNSPTSPSMMTMVEGHVTDEQSRPLEHVKVFVSTDFLENSLERKSSQCGQYSLSNNYPNPFVNSTSISYSLPDSEHVTLCIYDSRGNLVRMLVSRTCAAGHYTVSWEGRDDKKRKVGSGTFFYQLKTEKFIGTKKMCYLGDGLQTKTNAKGYYSLVLPTFGITSYTIGVILETEHSKSVKITTVEEDIVNELNFVIKPIRISCDLSQSVSHCLINDLW